MIQSCLAKHTLFCSIKKAVSRQTKLQTCLLHVASCTRVFSTVTPWQCFGGQWSWYGFGPYSLPMAICSVIIGYMRHIVIQRHAWVLKRLLKSYILMHGLFTVIPYRIAYSYPQVKCKIQLSMRDLQLGYSGKFLMFFYLTS